MAKIALRNFITQGCHCKSVQHLSLRAVHHTDLELRKQLVKWRAHAIDQRNARSCGNMTLMIHKASGERVVSHT